MDDLDDRGEPLTMEDIELGEVVPLHQQETTPY